MIIRKTYPQVYKMKHSKSGLPYFQVSARSAKWGMNERKTFPTENEALGYARQIEERIQVNGAQPIVPKEIKIQADAYVKLVERLTPHSKAPEEAVSHFIKFLGDEIIRQAKPTVGQLVDQFHAHKLLEKMDEQYRNEIKVHCTFIKSTWGTRRIGDLRKNEIEKTLIEEKSNKNTRRKYLTFVKMFFNWVLGEDKGYIVSNPAMGIKFKPDNFEKEFYPPETLKRFLRYVAENHKELVGYYALLTFAGLRPSEGARIRWEHLNLSTGALHVVKGKTDARHPQLEPVAIAWLKWHRENCPNDAPFVPQNNMFNLEREVREGFKKLNDDKWIPDGLRHGFATFFRALKKNDNETAWYMGNSSAMIKKHYAKSIPQSELETFWGLTPAIVMGV
jgi:integrase